MRRESPISLVVDDETDMCWALEHLLRKSGFCVQTALCGEDACRLMDAHHFPLAFLDAKLPDVDGIDLARRLREIDANIRIVLVSGYFYTDDVVIQQALAEGLIHAFVSKPFRHDEILKVIASLSRA